MIRSFINLILCSVTFIIFTINFVNCQSRIGNLTDPGQFPVIKNNLSINFPADHGSHNEYRIEWWYLTANLKDENGNALGLQWTLFRAALEPENNKNNWESSQIWMGHAAITDKDFHLTEEKMARGGVLQAGVITEPFEAWIDDWYLKGSDWKNLTVAAKGRSFAYNLKLTARGPIIKHGREGFSKKSTSEQASAYYSQPFFIARGWVEQNGQRQSVKGTAWADHEWSSQFIADTQEGWDWFSLNFDTGEKLMLFQVREKDKNHFYSGTWIDTDGKYQPVDVSQIVIESVGPKPSKGYFTNWIIKIPNLNLDIKIKALNPLSEMNTTYPYWEGPISFNGTHVGNGYLEMTGYKN